MTKDKKENFLVENINIADEQLVVECSRSLLTENELSEDLDLVDDLLLIFFNVDSQVVGSDKELFTWQRGESQDSGEEAISLASYSDTEADLQTLKDFDSVTFSLEKFRPDPDGEAQCRMFEVPTSARVLKGYAPAVSGFNGENGLISSVLLYQCKPGARLAGNEDCGKFAAECREVLFNWYPGGSGEVLAADLEVTTDRVLLEIVYHTGTGWLYDSSGLKVYFSSRADTGAQLASRFLMRTESVRVECRGWLVSASLHTNRAVDNIRLSTESGPVTSGYQVHHQQVRHLLAPHSLDKGDQLLLDCIEPRQCFAVITIARQQGQEGVHCSHQQNVSQSKPPEKVKTSPEPSKQSSPSFEKTTAKITASTNPLDNFELLLPNSTNLKLNLTKIEAEVKSNFSYRNDIANLDIQPRFLDDVDENEYSKAHDDRAIDGEINFQNVYRNSSSLPLHGASLLLVLIFKIYF